MGGNLMQELVGQPMDGAFVVDCYGNVMNSAVRLGHSQERWLFVKNDGGGVGTRHGAALSTAVWMSASKKRLPSATIVRSDSGGVHILFAGFEPLKPKVFYVSKPGESGWDPIEPDELRTGKTPRSNSKGMSTPGGRRSSVLSQSLSKLGFFHEDSA